MTAGRFSILDAFLILFSASIVIGMLRHEVRDAPFWRATVTPLASIIGSGFLVVVPLLANITGTWSVAAIFGIVVLSFWIGDALRFNIGHESLVRAAGKHSVAQTLERLSGIALALAYVISITFYIRLMCGFVLTGANAYSTINADVLSTLVLAFIGAVGLWHGLNGLERLEEFSVTIKLAIIATLLAALIHYNGNHGYDLSGLSAPDTGPWQVLRQLSGMLLIVQGFETSKYLGASYGGPLRKRSMLFAQILAGVIYIVFVAMTMPLMQQFAGSAPSETAIIDLSRVITFVLPMMLVLAATMSQFSAAIADTIGAGGVIEDETAGRLPARVCYAAIAALAIVLIWNSNIFQVIAFASRAFAFYYLLQVILAARLASGAAGGHRRALLAGSYIVLALLLLFVVLFAIPVDA